MAFQLKLYRHMNSLYTFLLVSYSLLRCRIAMAPKRWLAHVNFDITLADNVSRGIKMRTFPCLITPSVRRMCVLPAPVCCITARWLRRTRCRRQDTASICAGYISWTPQTDNKAATTHAFKQLLLHPVIAIIRAVSAAVQSSNPMFGTWGRGLMLSPLKEESWATSWGTQLGERGEGVGLVMVVILCFCWCCRSFFWKREGWEAGKKGWT